MKPMKSARILAESGNIELDLVLLDKVQVRLSSIELLCVVFNTHTDIRIAKEVKWNVTLEETAVVARSLDCVKP